MIGNEGIDHIEAISGFSIQFRYTAIADLQTGLRVEWAFGHNQASLWPWLDKRFAVNVALFQDLKTPRSAHNTLPY
jgi:hypothetical protein